VLTVCPSRDPRANSGRESMYKGKGCIPSRAEPAIGSGGALPAQIDRRRNLALRARAPTLVSPL